MRNYKRSDNNETVKINSADSSLKYLFEILVPDFMVFVVGASLGIALMLHIIRLLWVESFETQDTQLEEYAVTSLKELTSWMNVEQERLSRMDIKLNINKLFE